MNRYDVLLVLLIVSLVGGLYGGALVAARILAILFFPILIARMSRCGYIKSFLSFFIIFYAYCLVSMLWTPDRIQGGKELVYWIVHFVYLCEILVFAGYANRPLRSISWGWTIMMFGCFIVAGWELVTNKHLAVAVDMPLDLRMASVTFGNRNTFITLLCFSFSWIAYLFFKLKEFNIVEKFILYFVVLMSILVLFFNASRGGVLSFMIMLLVCLVVYRREFVMNGRKSMLILCGFVITTYLVGHYSLGAYPSISDMGTRGGILHDAARMSIWRACLQMLYGSSFVGVGVGGMTASLQSYNHIFKDSVVASAHSLFMEILLQYGVIFFTITVLCVLLAFLKTVRVKNIERRAVLLMSLSSMPVYTIIDSVYLLSPQLFALIGSIYLFANEEKLHLISCTNSAQNLTVDESINY